MKLVMTLLCRDEADIVDAQVAFHLNAGVDFVIATDHRSVDGTTEILEAYAREGCLHLIREPSQAFLESEWITRMARLAASELGADWVINTCADEFWWPRGADLKRVLAALPPRYGIVQAFVRNFVPRPDDGSFFAERMTVRLSPHAPINDPTSPYRPLSKVAHRAHLEVIVSRGSHMLLSGGLQPLRGWYPIEVLHFPLRSVRQCGRKAVALTKAFDVPGSRPGTGYHAKAYAAEQQGRIEEYYDSMVVADDALARGLEDGTLVVDTRLRDVLRAIRRDTGAAMEGRAFSLPWELPSPLVFPVLDIAEDAAYAVDAATLGEADVVRAQRRLDELERRVAALEQRLAFRIVRRLARIGRRVAASRREPM